MVCSIFRQGGWSFDKIRKRKTVGLLLSVSYDLSVTGCTNQSDRSLVDINSQY